MDCTEGAYIAIPFRDQWPLLEQCLKSLVAARVSVPVHLMDTGSTPETLSALAAFRDRAPIALQLHRVEGLQTLTSRFMEHLVGQAPRSILIMNSDTIATPGFERRLLETLHERTEHAAVSAVSNTPADLFQYRSGFDQFEGTLLARIMGFAKARLAVQGPKSSEVPYLGFTCIALDVAFFRPAEDEPSPFGSYHYRDLDLTCRMRQLGGKLLVREDTFVWHRGHGTYRAMDQDALYEVIRKQHAAFSEHWGHLPEHQALMERLQFSALYHANQGNRSIQGT